MANSLSLSNHARRLRMGALAVAGVIGLATLAVLVAGFVGPVRWLGMSSGGLPFAWAAPLACLGSAILIAALLALARMLAHVEHGETFGPAATREFRRFALLLLVAAFFDVLALPLAQLLRAPFVGPGAHLHLGLDDRQAVSILVSAVLFFVARLFDEAARIDAENRSIV